MTEEKKHDEWHECGHIALIDDMEKPSGLFQHKNIALKELVEAKCKCCGGELRVLIGEDIIMPCGISVSINCPHCLKTAFKK